jgi:hypothetical protein
MMAILQVHPDVFAVTEETYIFHHTRSQAEIEDWWHRVCNQAQGRRVLEKTPRHVRHLGRVFKHFPQAKIVCLVRDGRDVSCSILRRTGQFHRGVIRWRQDNRHILSFRNHPSIKIVRYEDLVTAPSSTLRSLCVFLGLSFQPDMLRHHEIEFKYEPRRRNAMHAARRLQQIRQPIFDGRGRWQTEMTHRQLNLFRLFAGHLLARFDYPESGKVAETGARAARSGGSVPAVTIRKITPIAVPELIRDAGVQIRERWRVRR